MRAAYSGLLAAALAIAAVAPAISAGDPNVTTYHGDNRRSGAYVVPGLTWQAAATAHLDPAFNGVVSGAVYAQPLYWLPPGADHGMVIVATETNTVQALDSRTGAVIWRRTLGPVVPRSVLPCGNIDPAGITGTPVIDTVNEAIYVDAFVTQVVGPQHLIIGLNLRDGTRLPGWPKQIQSLLRARGITFDPLIHNQRSALMLIGNGLYVPFGGHAGDCLEYHGRVVGVDLTTHKAFGSWATTAQKGGIWSQGGMVYDGSSLFTATGNTRYTTTWGDGEAVIRLPLDLARSANQRDYFAPLNWLDLDNVDADLGSTAPVPLDLPLSGGGSQNVILQMGKGGNAYVLNRSNLGGISTAPTVSLVSQGAITTAPAVYPLGGAMAVAIRGGGAQCPTRVVDASLLAISVAAGSPPTVSTLWCVAAVARGAPIVTTSDGAANPIVWFMGGQGDGLLHGFRGDTGQVVYNGGAADQVVPGVRRFVTPVAAEGRLYVAGDNIVKAFTFGP